MPTLAASVDERVRDVSVKGDTLSVALQDGRTISAPLAWFPRLHKATARQRKIWKVCGGGYGIFWPEVDEHLSTEGLLRGARAPEAGLAATSASLSLLQRREEIALKHPERLQPVGDAVRRLKR